MASQEQNTINLKLLVDRENNHVIFAEADNYFVDVLFSFFTLPVGTVTRLLSKQSEHLELGCMHNLYRSVENLENVHFSDEVCKKMLLSIRNSSSDACRKLKVNIDDTEPVKYYMCPYFSQRYHKRKGLSTICNSQCVCGRKLNCPMSLEGAEVDYDDGVFCKGPSVFMITDDLQVMPLSTETTFGLLKDIGVKPTQALEKITVAVGHDEVSRLLKHSLFSKTSLSDTFLLEQVDLTGLPNSKGEHKCRPMIEEDIGGVQKISFDVLVQKSNNKIIYAEAASDFVNFLVSMLTFPFGAVLKHLGRVPFPRCITNLYRSLEEMNVPKYLKSEHHKQLLLSPKLPPQYGFKNQVFKIIEASPSSYFYSCTAPKGKPCSMNLTTSRLRSPAFSTPVDLVKVEEFVKGPITFMVTDELVITPYSSIAAIAMLEQLKIPIDDVEKRVVNIGHKEALQMLEASMTSRTALTSILSGITTKNIKQELC